MHRVWLLLSLTTPLLLAQECAYVVSPASFSLPATGDAALAKQLTVDVSRGGCAWTARSNVAWVTVSFGQSGTNDGTVGIRVEENREATTPTGSLTMAGQTQLRRLLPRQGRIYGLESRGTTICGDKQRLEPSQRARAEAVDQIERALAPASAGLWR